MKLIKTATIYQGGMRFAQGSGDAKVVMDAKEVAGGRGEALTPKQMVLQGLIGCTGMDVAAILRKKKVTFEDLSIEAEATQTKKAPQVFETIKLVYRIKAADEDRPHVEKAIKLSQTLFCGVSAMIKKTSQVDWDLDFQPLGE